MRWPAIILLAFFILNLATINFFPLVWQDEVMFTEPAANWAQYGKLFSRAWFYDNELDIWAGNSPLYTVLLAPWLKLFGITPFSSRSFGMCLATLGIGFWTVAAKRGGYLNDSRKLAFYLVILLTAYGTGISTRSGRYDTLGILIFGILAFSLTIKKIRLRYAAIFSVGALIPASGTYLIVPLFAASVVVVGVYGYKWVSSIITVFLGVGTGAIALILVLWRLKALEHYIYSTEKLSQINSGLFPKDPSLFFVLSAAGISIFARMVYKKLDKPLIIIIMYPLTVSLILISLGRFPNYYSWIVLFPIAMVPLYYNGDGDGDGDGNDIPRNIRSVAVLLLLVASAIGLPFQLGVSLTTSNRNYGIIRQLAARHVRADDVALVSAAAWYATWPIARKTYTTEYDIEQKFLTRAEEQSVSVMIVDPKNFENLRGRFVGNWQKIVTLDEPERRIPFLPVGLGGKLTWHYRLAIYRRDQK